ncbi:MAG: EamA family transporter [Cyanobacteriota bacterium]|jgi:transporter family protein
MVDLWTHWTFWAVAGAVLAALTSLLAKVGLEGIPSNLATLLRTLVVVAFLAVVVVARGEVVPFSALPRRSLLFLLFSGLATAGSWMCFFRALQMGPVARVAPIDKFSVVLVAMGGVALLGETLNLSQWLGVALIALGAALVAWS